MANVTFDGVTKRYGDVVAVDSLDLDIADGEFMVLLGPSGCGKTTALRMIAGLEDISEGTLRIGDRVVNDVDPAQRDISMVFQSYALYPHMTVARNIESPLLARKYAADGEGSPPRKLTKAERAERVAEAARVLDLTPYLKRKPGALSGGQRQRVALARAFVGRPQAFLMDEPLSNLDAKLRANTRVELVALHKRVATTIVYVTHDQVEAMTMATRIAIMSMGELQQVGTPQQVYAEPANLFVARFIGTPPMNTLSAEIVAGPAGLGAKVGDSIFGLPPGLAKAPAEGQAIVVGVRPEHLVVAADGPIALTVSAVEWLGHECLVSGTIGGQPAVVRLAGMSSQPLGSTMRLRADQGQMHLFDAASEARLP